MFLLKQILLAAIVPMVVAAAISSIVFFRGLHRAQNVLEPLAIGIGYLAGHLIVVGGIIFPPTDSTNWLSYFAVVTAIASVFCTFRGARWSGLLIMALTFAAALRLLLGPKFQYGWSALQGYCWLAILTASFAVISVALEKLSRRAAMAGEFPVFLLILCAGTFAALSLSGSLLLGHFVIVLGAAVFGSGFIGMIRGMNGPEGIAPLFSLLLIGILASGYFFADLPTSSAVLIAFAPTLALISVTKSAPLGFCLRVGLILVPILLAVLVAYRSSPPLDY